MASRADDSMARKPAEAGVSRAWQACQPCRRKKVKCDGKQPCHNCSSRGQACEFPEAKDQASASRYYATTIEARCQKLDAMADKLERITAQLTRAADALGQALPAAGPHPLPSPLPTHEGAMDLLNAATVLQSIPHRGGAAHASSPLQRLADASAREAEEEEDEEDEEDDGDDEDDEADEADEEDDDDDDLSDQPSTFDDAGATDQAAAMVTDSYGRLRFVGGATNRMLIDAAKSMSPTARQMQTPTPGGADGDGGGSGSSPHPMHEATAAGPATGPPPAPKDGDVELPLFVRGKTWPELPFLPRPEQLARPPQYVSDLLVGLYFARLHYTFPVLFKPHFLARYARLLRGDAVDKEFLMVFFAVCACAAGLLPREAGAGAGAGTGAGDAFPGFAYYEKALLLHYAAAGQASLERVQCLGLLAMCTASWNTLTQSWSLAGQAVRLSMDIGFHVNGGAGVPRGRPDAAETLRLAIARRTWWSVFCLERVVSICLGRPVAVDDKDCCCALPLDLGDEALEAHCRGTPTTGLPTTTTTTAKPSSPSPLTGFLAFARLCQISVQIQQLSAPLRLRQLSSSNRKARRRYLARVAALDAALRAWLESLPDAVRFSANALEQPAGGESGLVMCVIVFMMHAGSLLNLYRCLAGDPARAGASARDKLPGATAQCLSAAKSCISAAELVRDLVPSSHYLALCVHYLTLSGVALLRMAKPDGAVAADAARCVGLLKDLELRWSGAGRSRAIVEHLLGASLKAAAAEAAATMPPAETTAETTEEDSLAPPDALDPMLAGHKRPFSELDDALDGLPWRDMLWTDLLDGDLAALGSW